MRERIIHLDSKKALKLTSFLPCPDDCPIQGGQFQPMESKEDDKLSCYKCGLEVDLDKVKIVFEQK